MAKDDEKKASSTCMHLSILNNADFSGPQYPAVELEALLLGMETASVRLVGLRGHEDGFVHIGIKLLARFAWVEALEAVLLQCVDQDAVCHLNTIVQRNQVGVIALELLWCHSAERAIQVVYRLYKVPGEALDGEVFSSLGLTLCAFLEVAKVGNGAEVLVLQKISSQFSILGRQKGIGSAGEYNVQRTLRSMISLSFFSNCSLSCETSLLPDEASPSVFVSVGFSFSFGAAGASEYHRIAGVAATRVMRAGCCVKADGRRAACLEARRIVLCSMAVREN